MPNRGPPDQQPFRAQPTAAADPERGIGIAVERLDAGDMLRECARGAGVASPESSPPDEAEPELLKTRSSS